jgi:hypothetical protein
MEDDLKIFKLEYLSNHLFDTHQLLNLNVWDLTKLKKKKDNYMEEDFLKLI